MAGHEAELYYMMDVRSWSGLESVWLYLPLTKQSRLGLIECDSNFVDNAHYKNISEADVHSFSRVMEHKSLIKVKKELHLGILYWRRVLRLDLTNMDSIGFLTTLPAGSSKYGVFMGLTQ